VAQRKRRRDSYRLLAALQNITCIHRSKVWRSISASNLGARHAARSFALDVKSSALPC
jgi:hypothetical protein